MQHAFPFLSIATTQAKKDTDQNRIKLYRLCNTVIGSLLKKRDISQSVSDQGYYRIDIIKCFDVSKNSNNIIMINS